MSIQESVGCSPEAMIDGAYDVDVFLDGLQTLSPDQQLSELSFYPWEHIRVSRYGNKDKLTHDEIAAGQKAFSDFAADETSSPSLTVRIEALERALEWGYMQEIMPISSTETSNSIRIEHTSFDSSGFKHASAVTAYRCISQRLLDHDTIDRSILFPPSTEVDIDRGGGTPEYNPILAYIFLTRVEDALQSGDQNNELQRFAPLLHEVNEALAVEYNLPVTPNISLKDWWKIDACENLLTYGSNYSRKLIELIETEDPAVPAYMELFGRIDRWIHPASLAFPKRYKQGVQAGLSHELADALYSTVRHIRQGNITDARLPLKNGGDGLPLYLEGDEVLTILAALSAVYEGLGSSNPQFSRKTIRLNNSGGFGLYRIIHQRGSFDETTVHIRPRGDYTFDPAIEYGRGGEGVEASIGKIVDIEHSLDLGGSKSPLKKRYPDEELPRIGKQRTPDDTWRVCVRLDREGVRPEERDSDVRRDPTQKQGTLSLDIGSVLGKDHWIGVKLGRFLAYGNMLRTQEMGGNPELNHVTRYFTAEDGDADVFAEAAGSMMEVYEAARLTKEDVARMFANRVRPVAKVVT